MQEEVRLLQKMQEEVPPQQEEPEEAEPNDNGHCVTDAPGANLDGAKLAESPGNRLGPGLN
jgi:hypothetical protein